MTDLCLVVLADQVPIQVCMFLEIHSFGLKAQAFCGVRVPGSEMENLMGKRDAVGRKRCWDLEGTSSYFVLGFNAVVLPGLWLVPFQRSSFFHVGINLAWGTLQLPFLS